MNLNKIGISQKAAFLSAIVSGYAVHLFAFTNLIPNCDGISRVYDKQQMLMSGRWFLSIASLFHGYTESPALIGFLSLVFMGLAAAITSYLLGMTTVPAGILTGAFFVVNIAWAYTYTFIFTASAYALSILLAVTAVLICFKQKRGWLFGGLLLAFSIGIYQVYLSLALALAAMVFIFGILRGSKHDKTGRRFLRLVGFFGVGAAVYLLILKICLTVTHSHLADYKGINSFGTANRQDGFTDRVSQTFKDFFDFLFTGKQVVLHRHWWALLNLLVLVLIAFGLAILIRRARREGRISAGKWIWLLLALIFWVFSVNFTSFMYPSSMWMRMPFILFYVFAAALTEECVKTTSVSEKKRVGESAVMAVFAAVLLFHAQYANTVYTGLELAHKGTESFLTTLVSRIQGTAGYRSDMDVIIIGIPDQEVYQNGVPELNLLQTSASPCANVLAGTKHIYYYLNDWLSVRWREPSEEEFIEVSDSEEFPADADLSE